MPNTQTSRKAKKKRVTREEVAASVRALGVEEGDIMYVRAAVWAVGRMEPTLENTFLGGLLDAVGDKGTVVGPAFNLMGRVWRKAPMLDLNTKPYTGLLSEWMLAHPDAVRSSHPSHSMVAIGANAVSLMDGHSPDKACFEPIRQIMRNGGKQILIGCVKDSPGFPTGHLAQFDLGLSHKHYLRFLNHAKIRDANGSTSKFRSIEAPGCSVGFHRFYADHVMADNMRIGRVGAALSVCVRANEAYETERAALEKNPKYAFCDSPTCLGCRVFNGYNLAASPLAATRWAVKKLRSKFLKG